MQALVWTGPRQMEMQDLPAPTPGPGEVRLRVGVVGICGSDLSGYLGQNSLRVPPLVMGHEIVGTIEAIGMDGAQLASNKVAQVGQRVAVNPLITCGTCDLCRLGRPNLCRKRAIVGIHRPGGLASLVTVPAAQCYSVPAGLADAEAALAEPLACGIRAVAQSRLNPGEPLLILGAGSIGLLCLIAARRAQAGPIIITDTSAERLQVASRLGAAKTVRADQEDVVAAVESLSDGRGVPAAIDAVGLQGTRAQAVKAVRPGGRAVFIGLHHETAEIEANFVVRQEVEIAGAFSYLPVEFARSIDLLQDRAVPDTTWVTECSLDQGVDVFADLIAGRSDYVKVALRPG